MINEHVKSTRQWRVIRTRYDVRVTESNVRVCVEAVERGVVFELCYSAAVRDSTMRRYTIANALSLMESCKGKVRYVLSAPAGSRSCDIIVTSLWGHWFNFLYDSSINSDCLSFRMWSCPVLLRRSVTSPLVILISINQWYWSVQLSKFNPCLSSGSGAQGSVWHHQPVSFWLLTTQFLYCVQYFNT